ncbi:hypothetical protein [Neomoorella thermoacetica]|uniref:hypothetical protein n=1 Tax=Neomoorella thermoacetica TaxID=1525 RepID=UPI0030D5E9BF
MEAIEVLTLLNLPRFGPKIVKWDAWKYAGLLKAKESSCDFSSFTCAFKYL